MKNTKKELTFVTFIDLLFLLLLTLSGMTSDSLSEVVYYLAFGVPIALGLLFIRKFESSCEKVKPIKMELRLSSFVDFLPILFPAVALVFLISLLTSLLLGSLGITNSFDPGDSFLLAIIIHAIIPAVLEELLFRYIPLKLLTPHSPRLAVIFSSLFFSLIHANLFQIPYAFAAGLIFALADLFSGSILPSLILHLFNNVISLVFMFYIDETSTIYFALVLGALAFISLVFIFLKKTIYKELFTPLKADTGAVELSLAPLSLIALTLCLAVTNLFA